MARRELAWRVFAAELNRSVETERAEGDRATEYLVSPFGSRVSRVLLAGSLTAAEPLARDATVPVWRARLRDPTDSVTVVAGGIRPRALAQLRRCGGASSALVVGRARAYRGRDGVPTVSVWAEAVRAVSEEDERAVLAETLRQTLDRLDLLERFELDPDAALGSDGPLGGPAPWRQAVGASLRRYPSRDTARFRSSLASVLRRVRGESGPEPRPASETPNVVAVRGATPAHVRASVVAGLVDEAEGLLGVVDELAHGSSDGYADLSELRRRATELGVREDRTEVIVAQLEESGQLLQPLSGKLRRS